MNDKQLNVLEIEANEPVETYSFNGVPLWPYLRSVILDYVQFRGQSLPFKRTQFPAVRSFFYGCFHWLRSVDFIFIGGASDRILINGRYVHHLLDPIVTRLKSSRYLFIEKPFVPHYPRQALPNRQVVSFVWIWFISFFSRISQAKTALDKMLNGLRTQYGIDHDLVGLVLNFEAQYRVFKWVFKWKMPRAIFVDAYMNYHAAVKAARDLGIDVIEVQHSAIGMDHFHYHAVKSIDPRMYPSHMLTFSGFFSNILSQSSSVFASAQMHNVGRFILDFYLSMPDSDRWKPATLESFSRVVSVSSQITVEKDLIQFICEAAALARDTAFVFVPRNLAFYDYLSKQVEGHDNVFVEFESSVYAVIMASQVHATVYSSTALEAPVLGVPTLLIDRHPNVKIVSSFLKDTSFTRLVSDHESFISACYELAEMESQTIKAEAQFLCDIGYDRRLDRCLKELNYIESSK